MNRRQILGVLGAGSFTALAAGEAVAQQQHEHDHAHHDKVHHECPDA